MIINDQTILINLNFQLLTGEKTGSTYHDSLQRGGLKVATDFVSEPTKVMTAILLELTSNQLLKDDFNNVCKQKPVLSGLTFNAMANGNHDFTEECPECGLSSEKLFRRICSPLSNILLVAYVRQLNNLHSITLEKNRMLSETKRANSRLKRISQSGQEGGVAGEVNIFKKRKIITQTITSDKSQTASRKEQIFNQSS